MNGSLPAPVLHWQEEPVGGTNPALDEQVVLPWPAVGDATAAAAREEAAAMVLDALAGSATSSADLADLDIAILMRAMNATSTRFKLTFLRGFWDSIEVEGQIKSGLVGQ